MSPQPELGNQFLQVTSHRTHFVRRTRRLLRRRRVLLRHLVNLLQTNRNLIDTMRLLITRNRVTIHPLVEFSAISAVLSSNKMYAMPLQ